MPVFAYEAVDSSARDFTGTIAADTPRDARDKLRAPKAIASKPSRKSRARRPDIAGFLNAAGDIPRSSRR